MLDGHGNFLIWTKIPPAPFAKGGKPPKSPRKTVEQHTNCIIIIPEFDEFPVS
jgi:hypothetical protein